MIRTADLQVNMLYHQYRDLTVRFLFSLPSFRQVYGLQFLFRLQLSSYVGT